MNKQERITQTAAAIEEWFARHKRTLPWRDAAIADDDERAYRVLVSEITLQQTQVPRVRGAFVRFLDVFPTRFELARAGNKEVLLAWRGMGYNARALRLRDAVRYVCDEAGGTFPRDMEDLCRIKGIGHYTAAAVRNFAWNLPTACIDTNIRRIVHRTFIGPERQDGSWPASDAKLLTIADALLRASSLSAADWHAALMDYGSLVQTKRAPKWDQCILHARGLMKATPSSMPKMMQGAAKEAESREPGRMIGARYVPDRIIRGRVIDALRDAEDGLDLASIGAGVCIDWNPDSHEAWLQRLINKLEQEGMLTRQGTLYTLGQD